jgi:hypothetical protein
MMTMNRRSDKLGWSTHPGGGLHDLSRQRTDGRASTQADSPQPRPRSGAGSGVGCQRGHGGQMAVARRSPRPLQLSLTPTQRFATRSRTLVGLAGLAADRPPTTQLRGRLLVTGPVAVALSSGCCGRARFVSRGASARLSPGVHPYRYRALPRLRGPRRYLFVAIDRATRCMGSNDISTCLALTKRWAAKRAHS